AERGRAVQEDGFPLSRGLVWVRILGAALFYAGQLLLIIALSSDRRGRRWPASESFVNPFVLVVCGSVGAILWGSLLILVDPKTASGGFLLTAAAAFLGLAGLLVAAVLCFLAC